MVWGYNPEITWGKGRSSRIWPGSKVIITIRNLIWAVIPGLPKVRRRKITKPGRLAFELELKLKLAFELGLEFELPTGPRPDIPAVRLQWGTCTGLLSANGRPGPGRAVAARI